MIASLTDVKRVAGLDDAALADIGITDAQITEHIYDAEAWIERECQTTFLTDQVSNLTATAATNSTISVSTATWVTNTYANYFVYIISGTGAGQWRRIVSNTGTQLTITPNWTTNPSTDSVFSIVYAIYTASLDSKCHPYQSITVDGNGLDNYFIPKFPLLKLDSLTINSTSVTPTNVYQYNDMGKLQLKNSAEKTIFDSSNPQLVSINYWYGVYPTPRIVKRAVATFAAMSVLAQQIGGTFNDVSSFTLPEISGSTGEPYMNIRETIVRLQAQLDDLLPLLPKYYHFI